MTMLRRFFLSTLALMLLLTALPACAEESAVVYLAPGAENGDGTQAAPYGDVLLAVAKELATGGAKHITLQFAAGEYYLTETLSLTGADFHGASLELVCKDAEPAIIGAWLPVTGFTATEVNGVTAWVADMPKLNGETVYSHQFFSADYERLEGPPGRKRAICARNMQQISRRMPLCLSPDKSRRTGIIPGKVSTSRKGIFLKT